MDDSSAAPLDPCQAAQRYRQAAEQGNADAQYNLGVCYDEGLGVPQIHREAAEWYRKAAEQGHAAAQHNLGVCHSSGEGTSQKMLPV